MFLVVIVALTLIIAACTAVVTRWGLGWANGVLRSGSRRRALPHVSRVQVGDYVLQGTPDVLRNAAAIVTGCVVTRAFGVGSDALIIVLITAEMAAWDLWRLSFGQTAVKLGVGGSQSQELGRRLQRDGIIQLVGGLFGTVLAAVICIRLL